ncbi:MAG: hypothetical protein ACXABY_16915 [Candidatus Thorarchaeota archaeon]|jgi:hypothetical protein
MTRVRSGQIIHLYIHNVTEAVRSIDEGIEFVEEEEREHQATAQPMQEEEQGKRKSHSENHDCNMDEGWKTALDVFGGHSSFA